MAIHTIADLVESSSAKKACCSYLCISCQASTVFRSRGELKTVHIIKIPNLPGSTPKSSHNKSSPLSSINLFPHNSPPPIQNARSIPQTFHSPSAASLKTFNKLTAAPPIPAAVKFSLHRFLLAD